MMSAIRVRGFASKSARSFLLAGLSAALCASPAAALAPSDYLNGAPLAFTLPAAPSDPAVVELELTIVRAAHPAAGSPEADEAIVDAKAFGADELVGRFADAAQAPLAGKTRPMLVRLLSRALPEVGHYSEFYKKVAERPRPYIEDPGIALCYDNPLHPLDPKRSYPSGHAANGYSAALLIAEVIPARRQQILARGIRYGENRLACGAHHPSDVLQGQLIAIAYFRQVSSNDRFKRDVECARAENAVIEGKQATLPASCTAPGA
ncbi:MAG: phosphatase PAP2 family protein [Pseudomonadota bacterium]